MKAFALVFFALLATKESVCQCNSNVFTNASFNGQEGEAMTATSWTNSYSWETPDVNDATGSLNTTPCYVWSGVPIPSPDGGTWQNLWGNETVHQTVELHPCRSYRLSFYFAAQGIICFDIVDTGAVGVEVYVNDSLVLTTSLDATQYTWEYVTYDFISTSAINKIALKSTSQDYVAIDGACLSLNNISVDIVGDSTICAGDTIILQAYPVVAEALYAWQNNDVSPTTAVTAPGSYSVIATIGCDTAFDSIVIALADNCPFCHFSMPNAFTPNNDGLNDIFKPVTNCELTSYRILIFDRWGRLIFTTDNACIGWNGKYRSIDSEMGTYSYHVVYRILNNQLETQSGNVTLLR